MSCEKEVRCCFIYFIYILLLIYKVKHYEMIDLKKNTYLVLGIVFMNLVLYGFMIVLMFVSSPAMKVVIICFIVHLFIYMKDKYQINENKLRYK